MWVVALHCFICPVQNLSETGADTFVFAQYYTTLTTFSNGYLGSRNDEERSEMRYVMRIAEFRESSNL